MEGKMIMGHNLTVDFEANAAYLQLTDNPVEETCQVAPGVLVDLDAYDMVVGVEVLDLDIRLPLSELQTKYHVPSDATDALNRIRPSVTTFVARNAGGIESTSTSEAVWKPVTSDC